MQMDFAKRLVAGVTCSLQLCHMTIYLYRCFKFLSTGRLTFSLTSSRAAVHFKCTCLSQLEASVFHYLQHR